MTKNDQMALERKDKVTERERQADCYQGTNQHVDNPTEQGRDLNRGKDVDLDLGLASPWLKRRRVGTSTLWRKR